MCEATSRTSPESARPHNAYCFPAALSQRIGYAAAKLARSNEGFAGFTPNEGADRLRRNGLEDQLWDVEVRGDVLHVIVVLELLDQTDQLLRRRFL